MRCSPDRDVARAETSAQALARGPGPKPSVLALALLLSVCPAALSAFEEPAALPTHARQPTTQAPSAAAPWLLEEDWYLEALRSGTVLNMKPIGTGITNPHKAEIEFAGRHLHTVWKPIQSTATATNKESYCAEIVAYRLSRELGIQMVPPTVQRKIGRRYGSLQLWVDGYETGASVHAKRRFHTLDPHQLEVMRFFDVLIDNTDRHANNFLANDSGSIVLIDHSRSLNFDNWGAERDGLLPSRFRRDVVNGLRALSSSRLEALLGDLLTRGDLKALHRAAQRLLLHVDGEVQRLGENSWLPSRPGHQPAGQNRQSSNSSKPVNDRPSPQSTPQEPSVQRPSAPLASFFPERLNEPQAAPGRNLDESAIH